MTVISSTDSTTATFQWNQRKVDRCQNGVLWSAHAEAVTNSWWRFYYSTDNGATWTNAANSSVSQSGGGHTSTASFFIDVDDYGHFVFKDGSDGFLYYVRGTPNAARTEFTWSSPLLIADHGNYDYPDLVAFREGTGWQVAVAISYAAGTTSNYTAYARISVDSGGNLTPGNIDNLPAFTTVPDVGRLSTDSYGTGLHVYPSIDFNHTGDGKTVAGDTPHLYAGWTAGDSGIGKGTRFRKAVYSAGSWTWNDEREIDHTRYNSSSDWLNCLFDGTRVILAGFMAGGDYDLMLYERDAADTTTNTRILMDGVIAADRLHYGSGTYDTDGNVYFFGRNTDEANPDGDLVYRKWDRASSTLSAETILDATGGQGYVSAKRGASDGYIEGTYTDGSGELLFVTYVSILLNESPNAPTSLAPDGATIDKDITQRFSWAHSDPDGDAQSAYDLRYRVQGTTTWTTVSGGATQYHDFAGGTFTADDWEWQVRTTDNAGAVGPWSASATFTAAATPAAPSISSPVNNSTISAEKHTVQWTASAQDAYEVRRVADDGAGNPDTATVYATTGTVESTGRSRTMTFDVNKRDEHVQVRVRSSSLWSTWASVKVTVSYTVPNAPTLVVEPVSSRSAHIAVAVTNPPRNLLTDNQASLETDTTGYNAGSYTSIVRDTTQAKHGSASLKITNTDTVVRNINANTLGAGMRSAVTPGKQYTALASYRDNGTVRNMRIDIRWYRSDGSVMNNVAGSEAAMTASTWTQQSTTATAPADAATAGIILYAMNAGGGESFYIDAVSIHEGSGTDFQMPTPAVDSNDVKVRLASGETAIDPGGRKVGGDGIRIATGVARNGTHRDRAAAAGVNYEYQAVAHGDNGTTAVSAWTAPA